MPKSIGSRIPGRPQVLKLFDRDRLVGQIGERPDCRIEPALRRFKVGLSGADGIIGGGPSQLVGDRSPHRTDDDALRDAGRDRHGPGAIIATAAVGRPPLATACPTCDDQPRPARPTAQECETAHEALAWTFDLPAEDYAPAVET